MPDEGVLLRGKASAQVLLHVKDAKSDAGAAEGRDLLVTPISVRDDALCATPSGSTRGG